MEAKKIIKQWKEDVLSKVCSSCEGHCCTYSDLTELTKEQAELIMGGVESDLVTKAGDDEYTIRFDDKGCPQHIDSNCNIYKHPLRPKQCEYFPLRYSQKDKTVVILGGACPATEPQHIRDLCQELTKAGITINYRH